MQLREASIIASVGVFARPHAVCADGGMGGANVDVGCSAQSNRPQVEATVRPVTNDHGCQGPTHVDSSRTVLLNDSRGKVAVIGAFE